MAQQAQSAEPAQPQQQAAIPATQSADQSGAQSAPRPQGREKPATPQQGATFTDWAAI